MSGIDPNAGSVGPTQGPSNIPPVTTEEEAEKLDPTASTLSQSLAAALLVQLLPNFPVLENPNEEAVFNVGGVSAVFAAGTSQIVSDMLDSYLDHIAEQKERIQEYLESAAYRKWVEDRTMGGQVKEELATNIDTESPVRNATEYNMYLNSRVQNAVNLWTDTADGVSNFIAESRKDNPTAALFIATSFAITSTYIGDYTNIVDVASTDMVAVNPIQNSVKTIIPMVPAEIQQQFTMAINLYAVGLINFSNAESILKTGEEQHRAPTDWETIVTFAHNVMDNVSGNVINAYLMAMLVNNIEHLGQTQEQREVTLNKLAVLAKAMMLSVAVSALLKGATPDLKLTGDIFISTMTNPLEAQSEEDQKLVDELSPLILYFNQLRAEGGMPEEFWDNLMAALGDFFDDNPDVEDLVSPSVIYAKLVKNLFSTEIEG